MVRYIDIHTHLAWNVDDGFETKEETTKALQLMKKQGVQGIVATPHFIPGVLSDDTFKMLNERIEELKELGKSMGIQIYSGGELFLNHSYHEAIKNKWINPINGTKYLLVEFDVRQNIKNNDVAEDILYEILISGYIPVIAHVERYFHDGIDISRVNQWKEMGCVIQINTSSIEGTHGETIRKNAMLLIEEGIGHLLGTDCHRYDGRRSPEMVEVYHYLQKKYGNDMTDLLFYRNAVNILENQEVEELPKIKRSLFKRILGRR